MNPVANQIQTNANLNQFNQYIKVLTSNLYLNLPFYFGSIINVIKKK